MTLISGLIPNMINGVSQQPQTVRNPSQAEEQINFMSTASRGLRKRPGSTLIATPNRTLTNGDAVNALIPFTDPKEWAFHAYKRSDTEQYHIGVHGPSGKVRVTNLVDGFVREYRDTQYLITADAAKNIRFLTVADTTFILNTARVVARSATTTRPLLGLGGSINTNPNRSDLYVTVDLGNYGKTYRIEITMSNGQSFFASYTTPNGGNAADAPAISTTNIASRLAATLTSVVANLGLSSKVQVRQFGHVLWIWVPGPSNTYIRDFVIEDGFSGQAMSGFNQIVDDFTKLPSRASASSSPIKVVEGADKGNKGYYVRFEVDGSQDGTSGQWRECEGLYDSPTAGHSLPAPGPSTARLRDGFNSLDMPIILTNTGVNTFTLTRPSWAKRKAGDKESAPDPSFVGKTITGMFFHRNRLGFLSEDGVTLSEANNFYNLYPTSVIQVLDKDTIDIKANTTVVDSFHSASPFDRDLFIFGARTQYRLSGEPLLTPKTAEMKLVTSYENDDSAAPSTLGNRIVFTSSRGVYSSVRELFITNDNTLDAPLITGVVPEYIPAKCRCLATSSTDDIVALVPPTGKDLFVYTYFLSGNEKLMSSWSRWQFTDIDGGLMQPLHVAFLGSLMYVTLGNEAGAVRINRIDLSYGDTGVYGKFQTAHMDTMITLPGVFYEYDPVRRLTLIKNLGSAYSNETIGAVVYSSTAPNAGQEVAIRWVPEFNGTFEIEGDLTNPLVSVTFGAKFNSSYTLSTLYLRRQQGQSTVSDTLATLKLRRMTVVYENTPRFTVSVTPEGRPERFALHPPVAESTARGWEGKYAYPVVDGRFSATINTKNEGTLITLSDNSPHPVNFLSATWEAIYVRHSKAV